MKNHSTRIALVASFMVLVCCSLATAQGILSSADEIIAFDFDFTEDQSTYPMDEGPDQALDIDPNTKYLNFGKITSGFIVTPLFGPSTVRSMLFTTANDFADRDPASWVLHGTNAPIVSTDNSRGTAENWTKIASGDVTLPDTRMADGSVLSFPNETSYASYRLLFPTLKDNVFSTSMQIADVRMFESMNGSGSSVVDFPDFGLAVDLGSQSNYPGAEGPASILDGDPNTKYLNFGEENAGFIVTPAFGSAAVKSFQITTANDAELRDPSSWELYGTNEAVVSVNNGTGGDETWTLIDSGTVDLPMERLTAGAPVLVNNTTEYTSYRMVFPTVRFPDPSDAIQFADIQFFNVTGDFNEDTNWDCTDVDALVAEIVAGTNTLSFDMTTDGVVDDADLVAWLFVAGGVNADVTGGNSYLLGDANLDGTVDGGDFLTWNTNKFSAVAAWCSGDFDASGFVDGGDFLLWNTNKFMSSGDPPAVPEPSGVWWLLALMLMNKSSLITRRFTS